MLMRVSLWDIQNVLFCFCGGDIYVVGNNKGMVDHN